MKAASPAAMANNKKVLDSVIDRAIRKIGAAPAKSAVLFQ